MAAALADGGEDAEGSGVEEDMDIEVRGGEGESGERSSEFVVVVIFSPFSLFVRLSGIEILRCTFVCRGYLRRGRLVSVFQRGACVCVIEGLGVRFCLLGRNRRARLGLECEAGPSRSR